MDKDNKSTELNNTDKKLHISDVMKRVETDQLILIEPDKIYGHFQLLKKENRKTYFLSKEEAKNLADFIYEHIH